MFIHNAEWHEKESFRLLPINLNCPYNEMLYDCENKVLMIISKDKKQKPMFIPAINKKGKTITLRRTKELQQERQIIEMYYEYFLEDMEDIKDMIDLVAVNNLHPILRILDDE
ncbi:MAG: hypothetical protein EOL97_08625 [Spirochaetia bacterium]|nr:hypothetical protein [Spirochaetia bacterium]